MKTTNIFEGKFYYTYIETGYNEQDFNHVYDHETRVVDCKIFLPDETGKSILQMEFETPDKKYKSFVQSDLKEVFLNRTDLLYLGFHLQSSFEKENKAGIIGNFVLEILEEMDGYHFFSFKIEVENNHFMAAIAQQDLIKNIVVS